MRKTNALSLLPLRRKAEEAAGGLPALITQAEKAAGSIMTGAHTQRRAGTGEKFWQFREYDPSDRPQDIDWRQSAKGDRVYVRQKEWQTTQTALFWCQNDDSMAWRSEKALPEKRETALVLALTLGILLTRAGEQIRVLENPARAGHSELAVQSLGESLLAHGKDSLPHPAAGNIPASSNLMLIGDFLAPFGEIEDTFKNMATRASGGLVIQILDPAELTFPYEGRIIFEGPPGTAGDRHPVDNAASVQTAYQKRIGAHLDGVKTLCRKYQWHWLLHTTDEDLRGTLHDIWLAMAPDIFKGGYAR